MSTDSSASALYFAFFNEIGIIAQLSRAAFEARLPDGLSLPHFSVLNHLVRLGDGQTPLELAKAFQVPKTTMTHTLAGLEAHGMIEMRANPRDGRSKCVWLTADGRTFRDAAIGAMEPEFAALAAEFPPEEMKRLVPQLGRVRQFLDLYRGAPAGTGGSQE